ncbi:MAG: P1 family peptidase [Clostridiales bacterium]|nr:P1 family peptidase [Clostridiales bacterium]
MFAGTIADVAGIAVGHATDWQAQTGVTAVLAPGGAVAGVDVRGGAPGTRETDAMAPGRLVERIQGVLLTGGSAFGLDAAGGAMKYLARKGLGYDTGVAKVPIVGAAVLFDLGVGDPSVRPDAAMGALACLCASGEVRQGRMGAGAGATIGKLAPGCAPSPGGVGTASMALPGGATIGAIVAVNSAGDVCHPDTGELLAGPIAPGGGMFAGHKALSADARPLSANTTIGVVATDARLTREQAGRLALCAHDGYARAIRPAHLPIDGDAAFALSAGEAECNFILLCAAAAEVMARAVANAAIAARLS